MATLLALSAMHGCTCRRDQRLPDAGVDNRLGDAASDAPPDAAIVRADLHLRRTAFFAYGSSTPLPISHEFLETVPELEAPLSRAAKLRTNIDTPTRLLVDRDVNYGQLTRLLQAAIGHHIFRWEIQAVDAGGTLRMVRALPPAGFPLGNCFATAWVGPDQRVHMGIDTKPVDASAGMQGVIVLPREGRVAFANVLSVVRRLDATCKEGHFRLLSQPSATFGPVFDLAVAMETATDKPKVSQIQFTVPSLGPLDSPGETIK